MTNGERIARRRSLKAEARLVYASELLDSVNIDEKDVQAYVDQVVASPVFQDFPREGRVISWIWARFMPWTASKSYASMDNVVFDKQGKPHQWRSNSTGSPKYVPAIKLLPRSCDVESASCYRPDWGYEMSYRAARNRKFSRWLILHEIAHHMAGLTQSHNERFRRALVDLIREFIGQDSADQLLANFADRALIIMTDAEIHQLNEVERLKRKEA